MYTVAYLRVCSLVPQEMLSHMQWEDVCNKLHVVHSDRLHLILLFMGLKSRKFNPSTTIENVHVYIQNLASDFQIGP